MEWTETHKSKGQNIKDFLQNEFGKNHKILDCKVKNFTTAYLAIKTKGKVYGLVCLLQYKIQYRINDYYNISYQDMDETMHPYFHDCPKSVLKLLSKTDNKNALDWRKECWDRHNIADSMPKN